MGSFPIIHRYFPSTFSVEVGEGLIFDIHSRWGRGLFAPPTHHLHQLWRHTVDDVNPLSLVFTILALRLFHSRPFMAVVIGPRDQVPWISYRLAIIVCMVKA